MTQTVVITGASSGIGKEAAKALAAQGWHVIAHGRDAARSAAAEAEIRSVATGRVDMIRGDLSVLADVARMADEIAGMTSQINALIANAGGTRSELIITPDGNEATFAGNHLGHFLLTKRLMPQLRATGAARVVSVSSSGHYHCPGIDWDDLQMTANWESGPSYCFAKLCNVLFTRELAKRAAGDGIVALAMEPGVVASNFANHCTPDMKAYMETLTGIAPADAAAPLVWLATSAEAGAQSGGYFNLKTPLEASPQALDDANAARLWRESEALLTKAGF